MAQGKFGHSIDILFANRVSTTPRSVRPRGAQPHQVSTQTIDAGSETTLGDLRQRRIVQRNVVQLTASAFATLTQGLLLRFPLRTERLRVAVEIQPPANDLATIGGCSVAAEGDIQTETIEQLRAQLALFRVHRADQHELRRMAVGNAVTLDQVGAAGGDIQQQIDQVIGQQIDFVDVEHAAVGLGQHTGENCARPALRAASRSRVPTKRSSVAPNGKVTNWPLASTSAKPRANVDLAMPRGPSMSTPPIFGSMAVRHRASFKSSAPTTAESGKCGVSVIWVFSFVVSGVPGCCGVTVGVALTLALSRGEGT